MTHSVKIGDTNFVFIEPEPDGICELCQKKDELRPYGPGGKRICFDCAQLPENKAEAERRFHKMIDGDTEGEC